MAAAAVLTNIYGNMNCPLLRDLPPFNSHGRALTGRGVSGTLSVELTVNLSESGSLKLRYWPKQTQKLPVNLTNHAYFTLQGKEGQILDHELQMHASSYLRVGPGAHPYRKEAPVQEQRWISGAQSHRRGHGPANGGYEFCYIIDKEFLPLKPCATVSEAHTGRCMTVATTLPACSSIRE